MEQGYHPSMGAPVPTNTLDGTNLAAARRHVQTLSNSDREALLRALLEYDQQPNELVTHEAAPIEPAYVVNGRLSVSTTSSASSGKGSFLSNSNTPRSSVSSQASAHSRTPSIPPQKPSTRAYWCTSCCQKLSRKFDWKRHDEEFHERPRKYPCPNCNRVFWGANTFNQHHKAAHGCRTCPHADKVVEYSRRKRAWGCGFCAAFLGSLERYHEHVALHYESGKTLGHWDHANVIYGLLHQPVVHNAWKQLQAAKFGHLAQDQRPKLSWDPRTTQRAHGFLENEAPGQLQDLLEFFDPSKHNADYIVRLADEKAIHVTISLEETVSPDLPASPQLTSSASHASLRPHRSKWASAAYLPPSAVADSFSSGCEAPDRSAPTHRPLPRVASHTYRAPIEHPAPAAEDVPMDMGYVSLEAQPSYPWRSSGDLFHDWDSLASTVVDDPAAFPLPPSSQGWNHVSFMSAGNMI